MSRISGEYVMLILTGEARQYPRQKWKERRDESMTKFKDIRQAFAQPWGKCFWTSYDGQERSSGHKESYLLKVKDDLDALTYDVSNNKATMNMLHNGVLKSCAFFHPTCRTDSIAGGWVRCDFIKAGPASFSIRLGSKTYDLGKPNRPYRTGFLGGYLPVSEYGMRHLKLWLLAFAPISWDGRTRPRAGVYGLMVENTSRETVRGKVLLPDISVQAHPGERWLSSRAATILLADHGADPFVREVAFELLPGEWVWAPSVFVPPGEFGGYDQIRERGTLYWLNETWRFFERMTGHIEIPDDPLTADILTRSVIQCAHSISMDREDNVAQGQFGSYNPGSGVNVRDSYYPLLPQCIFNPRLAAKGVLWFLKHGVRPKGNLFEGGVTHSLGNSLGGVMLAGVYYQFTGDRTFFLDHPGIKESIISILDRVAATRQDKDVWLFPSMFISDGYALGDYHTGSNLCAWHSFSNSARILDEVYSEARKAARYRRIAHKIRRCLDKFCVVDGPFGRQFNEGVDRGGNVKFLLHDGEECDTTLAPFYGYLSGDDARYKNFKRFAVSTHNPPYSPETRGIVWERYPKGFTPVGAHCSDATFPGYVTALAAEIGQEDISGPDGSLTEIKRLTDLNGVFWWWPYEVGAKRGEVRRACAQCAYGTGVFVAFMLSEFVGITFDAPDKTLRFRPCALPKFFSWHGLRLGYSIFDLEYEKLEKETRVRIRNLNDYTVGLRVELMANGDPADEVFTLNGKTIDSYSRGRFMGKATAILGTELRPEE